jgi:hypothetical protein
MIINSFGYEVTDKRNLGQSLTELVSQIGEPALKKVMEYHPDRDIILELNVDNKNSKCGCGNCSTNRTQDNFMNASGNETPNKETKPDTLAHQTNVILVVATLFIVTALIYKNK